MVTAYDKSHALHLQYSREMSDYLFKGVAAKLKELQRICAGDDGKSWDHDLPAKAPWTAVCARYHETLAKFDVKGLDVLLESTSSSHARYIDACGTLSVEAKPFDGQSETFDKAKITVGTSKLFGLVLGDLAKDKVKLRKAALTETSKLQDAEASDPARLLKLLPPTLRVKVDAAIKLKAVA